MNKISSDSTNKMGANFNQSKVRKSKIILKIFLGFTGIVILVYLFGIGIGEARSYSTEDNKHKIFEKQVFCFPFPHPEWGIVNICTKTLLLIDYLPYNITSSQITNIIVSDNKRVAYIANTSYGMKDIVYIDRKPSKSYEIVYHLFLTKDNKFRYLAVDGDYIKHDWVLMEEQTELWRVKDAVPPKMKASKDNENFAVVYKSGNKEAVSIDGQENEKNYDEVVKDTIIITDDGNHYGFTAHNKNPESYLIVIDGKEQKTYTNVTTLQFPPDGQHYAYKAFDGRRWHFVYDGQENEGYDGICPATKLKDACFGFTNQIFSPVGKFYYYIAIQGNLSFYVINNIKREQFDQVKFITSPNNDSHLAYIGKKNKTDYVIYDNKKIASHSYVARVEFSPDGKHFAYEATDDWEDYFIVLDGKNIGNKSDNIPNAQFSDDNKYLTYGDRGKFKENVPDEEYIPQGNFEEDIYNESLVSIAETTAETRVTDQNKVEQFTGYVRNVFYDSNITTTPENSVGAANRNVISLDLNQVNVRGDDIKDFIITADTQIFINGLLVDRSILEESNFYNSDFSPKYSRSSVDYYVYYTNLGGYVNVAKKIDFKN